MTLLTDKGLILHVPQKDCHFYLKPGQKRFFSFPLKPRPSLSKEALFLLLSHQESE